MPADHPPRYCCDQDFERVFDQQEADRDLAEWHAGGPPDATQELIDALLAEGIESATLLDIGAGVGIVHLELLVAGAASALDVDASSAYLAAARAQAERLGLADRVQYRFGDVVELVCGGWRSGMGYAWAADLGRLRTDARFMRITMAGREESHPHDVAITKEAPNYQRGG